MKTLNRRTWIAVAVLALLACATVVVAVGRGGNDAGCAGEGCPVGHGAAAVGSAVPGDLDQDGHVSDAEAATRKAAEAFTDKLGKSGVFASKGVDEYLITPASGAWWNLVNDYTGELGLAGTAAPTADWYAVSWGRSYKPDDGRFYYPALSVGFDSFSAAHDWVQANLHGALKVTYRGPVVTLTPLYVHLADEPLPKAVRTLDSAPKAGVWHMDVAQHFKMLAEESGDPASYTYFWRKLGFGEKQDGGMVWNAVSTSPDGPWSGALRGFDASAVDVEAAASRINLSGTACLEKKGPSRCGTVSGLINYFYAVSPKWSAGSDWFDWTHRPKDALVYIGMSPRFAPSARGVPGGDFSKARFTAWYVTPHGVARDGDAVGDTPVLTVRYIR